MTTSMCKETENDVEKGSITHSIGNDDDESSLTEIPLSSSTPSSSASDNKDANEKSSTEEKKSLEDSASFLSKILLYYLDPLLRLGGRKVLEQSDVGAPSHTDEATHIYSLVTREWEAEVTRIDAVNAHEEETWNQLTTADDEAKAAGTTVKKRKKPLGDKFKPAPPSMYRILTRIAGRSRILFALFLYTISTLLQFVPVLLLNDLVSYFETGAPTVVPAWAEAIGLGLVPVMISVIQTRHQVILMHASLSMRTSCSLMLYRKSLTISAAGRARTSTGQVVNMMSNDTNQMMRFVQLMGLFMTAPVTIVVALVLIYQQVGNATWVGVAFMFCLAPLNLVIFKWVGAFRRKVLHYSDLRVKMMNEVLNGIRIIKFYAWEKPFGKEVEKLREKELQALTKLAYLVAVGFSFILMSAPIIQPILVFYTYTKIQGEPLSAATAFTTVALFQLIRFPFAFLPMGLTQYVQSKIALRRLETYMSLPDLKDCVVAGPPPPSSDGDVEDREGSVTIRNGSFSWIDPALGALPPPPSKGKKKRSKRGSLFQSRKKSETSTATTPTVSMPRPSSVNSLASLANSDGTSTPRHTLNDITLTIPPGSLIAVVGTVGSGKSSLLSAIMGEMESVDSSSRVYIPRKTPSSLSYAAQSPWIVNDTLRNNILFGRPYDAPRYRRIVTACALTDDLAILPAGDLTEIGERGINLSGGQKARVSLARAVYAPQSKILLLDDPLSAVDSHVGEHIFSDAIASKELMEGVTRVLVTHHVHFLPRCDGVLVMEGGCVKHFGRYEDLVEQGVDFKGAAEAEDFKSKDEEPKEEVVETQVAAVATTTKATTSSQTTTKASSTKTQTSETMKKAGQKLIESEEKEEGSISSSAYLHYARAGGIVYVILTLLIQGLGRASEIMASFWLAIWADRAITSSLSGVPHTPEETAFYINIFALFSLLSVVGLTGRACAMAIHRLRASRLLHNDLTKSIIRAPVSFFDVTPIGRVLNRFAADMDKVDLELTQNLSQGCNVIFSVLGAIGAMTAATKGAFLVPLIPMGYIYYYVQKWYRKTSTELQRVTSIANSPIFTGFSQILSGTSTVRAYGEQERFFTKCQSSFNDMNAAYSLVQLTNYWLGLRLDLLGCCINAFIAGLAVATSKYDFMPAGWLGLALTYSIEVTGMLKYGVRCIAQIEADMSSCERILYYTENVTPEAPDVIPECDPKEGEWPKEGRIDVSHASMRYREGPLVLKDISMSVKPGEKIGVVGRTGSGKSSLMNLLFRIVELESDGGKITIDDVDISKIGTEVLRLNLSIIPQDPVLFSNTVRYNLDPFGNSTDEEVWDVLRKVKLFDVIATLPLQLEDVVTEGGENFSQGQRQLLCIARSLLRRSKIIVMDEATASIDNETDEMIQKMIRTNFKDATVLTIAHRLNTIMDSDRVLVLDDGNVAEFDTPEELMGIEGGIFRGMVEKSRTSRGIVE